MISGRSSSRRCCSGVRRFCTYLSSRISVERAPAVVLADDVAGDVLLRRAAGEEEREDVLEPGHETRLYPGAMRRTSREGRYAERTLVGVDDVGREERIVIWIERRPGAVWAVARAVNPQLRDSDEARREDLIFEGYELDDALERANEALEDDVGVLEEDGRGRGREAVHAQGDPPAARALVLQPLDAVAGASVRPLADPRRTQPGSRRRVHVLGADDGSRRHARARLRAGARRHPDAQPVGALRPARGDGDLARRVSVRPGGLRAAAARREHRLGLRADRRRARADDARGARASSRSSCRAR